VANDQWPVADGIGTGLVVAGWVWLFPALASQDHPGQPGATAQR
jgi:hypothetical protein